jgi:hypothetical protein
MLESSSQASFPISSEQAEREPVTILDKLLGTFPVDKSFKTHEESPVRWFQLVLHSQSSFDLVFVVGHNGNYHDRISMEKGSRIIHEHHNKLSWCSMENSSGTVHISPCIGIRADDQPNAKPYYLLPAFVV